MKQKNRKKAAGRLMLLMMAGVFAVCYTAGLGFSAREQPSTAASASLKSSPYTVVIDAGHGGADGGAVGIHGETEKEINLSIAQKLEQMLALSGFQTVMTRTEDVSIHDKGKKTLKEQKTSDIKNRLKIMEQYPNGIAVSVHQNHFGQEQYSGSQMFYSVKNEKSPLLAQFLQTSLRQRLQPDNQREVQRGPTSVYLLQHTTVPMVLVECGFLSNPEEAKLLADEAYQNQIAFAIYCGIVEYYNEESGAGRSGQE